jgi:hypothetical protein
MIKRFSDNRAALAAQRERITSVQVEARSRASAQPVFADLKRFSAASLNKMVWMPRTDGLHPAFV